MPASNSAATATIRIAGVARTSAVSVWFDRWFTLFAVIPTAVLMLVIFGIPLAFSLFISTRGWSIDQSIFAGRFAGFDNYLDLIDDPSFISSVILTFGYTAATVAAEMLLGLAVALLLNMKLRFIGCFRTMCCRRRSRSGRRSNRSCGRRFPRCCWASARPSRHWTRWRQTGSGVSAVRTSSSSTAEALVLRFHETAPLGRNTG